MTDSEFAQLSSIEEISGLPVAEEMIRLLVQGQEAVASVARSLFPLVKEAHNEPTSDLLTSADAVP